MDSTCLKEFIQSFPITSKFYHEVDQIFTQKHYRVSAFFSLFGFYGLVISDLTMLKQIMIKDFEYFVNRDQNENVVIDKLLGKTVMMLRDQKWKDMRTMLSPIFTSSKMKYIYGLLSESADEFVNIYEKKAKANGGTIEIDTHDVFARVTADGIASLALGVKSDCIANENSEMYKIADELETDFTTPNVFKNMLALTLPKVYKFFDFQIIRESLHVFFESHVLGEIQRRRTENIVRTDVIQLMVQAKEGQLTDDNDNSYATTKIKKLTKFEDYDLVAQSLVFFLGGFETTAFTLQSMSFELSNHPEIQQTLIEEVDEMLKRLEGRSISYEELNQMRFLDMVVNETLRVRPAFRATGRNCSKDYNLKDEETGKVYKIKKRTALLIPIKSIHMDPKYFPNPEKFDPYRFSDENKDKIQSGSFMPFGIGPRICIGSRYAILETKLLMFTILSKFSIKKCSRTPETLTFGMGATGYKEKIYLALKLRK